MRILITGGASGIGKATAEELKERNHEIVILDRDRKALEELDFESIHADVYDAKIEVDDLDVLINCAGYRELGSTEDMELETVEEIFRSNVFGPINMIRQLLPKLRENNGRIINVSSVAGRITLPFSGHYCGSKRALEAITDALRMETEEVDVTIVEPGYIETGFNRRAREALEGYMPDSIYSDEYREILDEGGMSGVSAEVPAKKIADIVEADDLNRRYQTPLRAKFFVLLHRITPRWLEEKILSSVI